MEQGKIRFVNRVNLFPSRDWLDEAMLEAIFQEHYARIYNVVFRLVGDREEADDLTAETFWRLWKTPPAQNENMAGWLYRVATRLGYNALRSNRRRLAYETQAGRSSFESSTVPDPEQVTEKRLERERVRACLRQLSERDVQLLVLRHSGLSYKELSETLGLTPTSIGSMLSRAEERFEKLYSTGDNYAPE